MYDLITSLGVSGQVRQRSALLLESLPHFKGVHDSDLPGTRLEYAWPSTKVSTPGTFEYTERRNVLLDLEDLGGIGERWRHTASLRDFLHRLVAFGFRRFLLVRPRVVAQVETAASAEMCRADTDQHAGVLLSHYHAPSRCNADKNCCPSKLNVALHL
jgi:hypothetical protein